MAVIFADFHHGALARSVCQTFAGRLGHTLLFPDESMCVDYMTNVKATPHVGWFPMSHIHTAMFPLGYEAWEHRIRAVDMQSATGLGIDVFLCTNHTNPDFILWVKENTAPSAKVVGVAGNAGVRFPWDEVPNLLSCDGTTVEGAPNEVHSAFFAQELCLHYGAYFVPVLPHMQRRLVNMIHGYMDYPPSDIIHDTLRHGYCPHCQSNPPYGTEPTDYAAMWEGLGEHLPEYDLSLYGHGSEWHGGRMLHRESHVLYATHQHGAGLHYKWSEGWGHAVLQMAATGRPPIVPEGYFRYKEAGRYLIPEVTCFEADRTDPARVASRIRDLTGNLTHWNEMCRRSFDVSGELMDWEYEARRVGRFMEELI